MEGAARILLTAALIGLALTHVEARTTPDSIHYLGAAAAFPWYPDSYFNWGPLYPALIALVGNAKVLNGILVACLGGTAAWIFRHHGLLAWFMAVSVVVLGATTQFVFSMVWSEGPFIVFTLGFLAFWSRYLDDFSPRALWAASAMLVGALLSRHIGVVLFAVCATTLLQANATWAQRLRSLTAVSVAPAGLYGLWMLRNALVFGAPTPERWNPSMGELAATLANTGEIIGNWVIPHNISHPVMWLVAVPVLGCAIWQMRLSLVYAHFVVIYLAAMVFLTAATTIPPMSVRFLSPLVGPMVVVVGFTLHRLYEDGSPAVRKGVEYALLVWALVWIAGPHGPVAWALT